MLEYLAPRALFAFRHPPYNCQTPHRERARSPSVEYRSRPFCFIYRENANRRKRNSWCVDGYTHTLFAQDFPATMQTKLILYTYLYILLKNIFQFILLFFFFLFYIIHACTRDYIYYLINAEARNERAREGCYSVPAEQSAAFARADVGLRTYIVRAMSLQVILFNVIPSHFVHIM